MKRSFERTHGVLVQLFSQCHEALDASFDENDSDSTAVAAPQIQFSQVSKSFDNRPVLCAVDLSITAGEVVVLLGPSGCGKSTLLRLINGLETPDSGQLSVLGHALAKPKKGFNWQTFRSDVGMVFQQFNLFPHMSVLENITLAPRLVRKLSPADALRNALDLLALVGLSDKAKQFPSKLSGGEKQRVALARALAMDPKILLLDEPTSALDPVMTHEVLAAIEKLAERGVTMVIVTHEVDFALRIADRIIFMDEGDIIQDVSPDEFLANRSTSDVVQNYVSKCVMPTRPV